MSLLSADSALSAEVTKKFNFIPLWIAYVAFPLSYLLTDYLGVQFWRNWIDVAWILLTLSSMTLRYRKSKIRIHTITPVALMMVVLFGVMLALGAVAIGAVPPVTAALELKPLYFLMVAVILVSNGVTPIPQQFCRAGVILSVVLVAEAALRSLYIGGLERPVGSGEVNYDASLILLSLVFALAKRDLAKRYAPILFVGLLASFSRTGLVAACLMLLISRTISVPLKIIAIIAALTGVVISFQIRGLDLTAIEGMDRYWMWVVGIKHFATHWTSLAINLAPGSSIDLDVPPYLFDLWQTQQEKLELEGIFPFHFHAMWMRVFFGWGWVPLLILLLMLIQMLFVPRGMPVDSRIYACTCLVLGLTMGLFYLSNVGVPYFLAWAHIRGQSIARKRQSNLDSYGT